MVSRHPSTPARLSSSLWLLLASLVLGACSKEPAKTAEVLAPPEGRAELVKAIQEKNLPVIRGLLTSGVAPTAADSDGRTPLHHAVESGDFAILEALLKHRPDVKPLAGGPRGLLALAVTGGQAGIVVRLVEAGAWVEDLSVLPKTSDASLQRELNRSQSAYRIHEALQKQDVSAFKSLLAGADDYTLKLLGFSPVHIALFLNNRADLTSLLKDEPTLILAEDSRGLSLLHHAALAAEPRMAELLVAARADIDVRTKEGRTPLMMAAEAGRAVMVTALLKLGASVNAEDTAGQSALTLALRGDNPQTVSRLVEAGAVVVRLAALENPRSEAARTQLQQAHQRFLLRWAVASKDFVQATELLRAGVVDEVTFQQFQWTPFHRAVVQNDAESLEKLAREQPQQLEALRLQDEWTLAHWAALARAERSVDWLASRDFPLELPASESLEWTPLDFALQAGGLPAASRLVAHGAALAHGRDSDERGREVVALALLNKDLRAAWLQGDFIQARLVLNKGASLNTLRRVERGHQPSPLQWQLLRGEPPMPEQTAELVGGVDRWGHPPLHYAVLSSRLSVVETVLGATPEVNRRDVHGETALHLAAAGGDEALMRRLLQAGADANARVTRKSVLSEDSRVTPLMAAARSGQESALRVLLAPEAAVDLSSVEAHRALEIVACAEQLALVKLLLSRGVYPERDSSCWNRLLLRLLGAGRDAEALEMLVLVRSAPVSPKINARVFYRALESKNPAVLEALLVGEQELDDRERENVLAEAIKNGQRASLERLLARWQPKPPLMRLALRHALYVPDLAALLLENGADPLLPDDYSISVAGEALRSGVEPFVALMESRPALWARLLEHRELLRPAARGGFVKLVAAYLDASQTPVDVALSDVGSVAVLDLLRARGLTFPTSAGMTDADLKGLFARALEGEGFGVARFLVTQGFAPQVSPLVEHILAVFPKRESEQTTAAMAAQQKALRALLSEPSWTTAQRLELLYRVAYAPHSPCGSLPLYTLLVEKLSPQELGEGARHAMGTLAYHCPDTRVIEFLVSRGADIQSVDEAGTNILLKALESPYRDPPHRLLSLGIQTRPKGTDSLAYLRASLSDEPTALSLLERGLKDGWLGAPEQLGELLPVALEKRRFQVAAWLLLHGASTRGLLEKGQTPASLSQEVLGDWAARLFVELGTRDVQATLFRAVVETDPRTAGTLATHGGVPLEALIPWLRQPQVHDALWRHALAMPGSPDNALLRQFLSELARRDDSEFLRLLIERWKPDLDRSGNVDSLLNVAVTFSKLSTVKLLVESGADVDLIGLDCRTALLLARSRDDDEGRRIARYLDARGARSNPDCISGSE